MKKKVAQIYFFIIFSLLYLVSCVHKDDNKSISKRPDNITLVALKIPFKATDSILRINYNLRSETELHEEINEQAVDNNSKIETGISYVIKKDIGNDFNLLLHYTKFKVSVKSNELDKELDAATAASSYDPADRILAAFNDATINAVVTSQGKVKSIKGITEIKNKMYTIADGDKRAIETIESFSKQYTSEEFFKNTIEQNFHVLSLINKKVGDNWEQNDTIKNELILPIKTNYKLESIQDGVATIELSADIDIEDQEIPMQNITVSATLKGKQDGEVKVDILTGLLKSSTTILKIEGKMEAMHMEIPFSLKTKSIITSEK